MTTKTIEELATNAVKHSILTTDYLDQYISENDREPTWDGSVSIYTDKRKRKCDFTGRVPVQIKGKVVDNISADKTTFSVSTVDLRSFLNDGGAIFFVVLLSQDGRESKTFYETLSPVKLNELLVASKKAATKSISLKAFPEDADRKATVFLQFFTECKKQASFKPADMLRLNDVETQMNISEMTMSVSGFGYTNADRELAFLENEVYLYGKQKGSNIAIPFAATPMEIHIGQEQDGLISANETVYYSKFTRVKSLDKTVAHIGKSFTITIHNTAKPVKFNYKSTPSLRNRITDMSFILDAIDAKSFVINGSVFAFEPSAEELQRFNVPAMQEQLDYLKRIQAALDALYVKKDIDLDKLTEVEKRELHQLVIAFFDRKPVPNLKPDLPPVVKIKIQDITVLLAFEHAGNTEGTYSVSDFFKSDINLKYYDSDGNEHITSKYSILDSDDYQMIDNVVFDAVIPSYQAIAKNDPYVSVRANVDMLNMLTAYDKFGNRELLQLAEKMSIWLQSVGTETLDSAILILNTYQISKRTRTLSIEEIETLCTIVEAPGQREDIMTGAYLLLDNQMAAQVHFQKMSDELQEAFRAYPIYHFFTETAESHLESSGKQQPSFEGDKPDADA